MKQKTSLKITGTEATDSFRTDLIISHFTDDKENKESFIAYLDCNNDGIRLNREDVLELHRKLSIILGEQTGTFKIIQPYDPSASHQTIITEIN